MTRIVSPWGETLKALIASARSHLLICSPFFDAPCLKMVADALEPHASCSGERVRILTDLSPRSVAFGTQDIAALCDFCVQVPSVVCHLPGLHAKVYVADSHTAIVTSGNLTAAGISRNYEYGVLLRGEGAVCDVRRDIEAYARLGVPHDLAALRDMAARATALAALRRELERSMREALREQFEEAVESTEVALIERRVRGETTNQLFARAVLYALREGPLTTREIHPRVKAVYPDLCDDSVDRVIDGRHFGKKWKHAVRSAQVYLKRRGEIELRDGKWRRVQG